MFSRIINQQIYDFFHKSFLVDFKDFFTKFCFSTAFTLKFNASVFISQYTFFKQSFNYLTDGKGIKDGAQPKYVVALSYLVKRAVLKLWCIL